MGLMRNHYRFLNRWNNLLKAYNYIFTNFVSNKIWKSLFPFSSSASSWSLYFLIDSVPLWSINSWRYLFSRFSLSLNLLKFSYFNFFYEFISSISFEVFQFFSLSKESSSLIRYFFSSRDTKKSKNFCK